MNKIQLSKYFRWFTVGLMFVTGLALNAQSLKLNQVKSTITISGTSNLHGWDSKVGQLKGEFKLNSSKQVQSLVIQIPVRSIKSGNGIMDKKTYEAFNADKNPSITFVLTEPVIPVLAADKSVQVSLTGNLSMAGVTKKISFKSTGKLTAAGDYEFTGIIPLKMTDFKIKPPTAVFGTLKTGDAVTLKYDVTVLTQNMASIE